VLFKQFTDTEGTAYFLEAWSLQTLLSYMWFAGSDRNEGVEGTGSRDKTIFMRSLILNQFTLKFFKVSTCFLKHLLILELFPKAASEFLFRLSFTSIFSSENITAVF
jgi:hypothetical protein